MRLERVEIQDMGPFRSFSADLLSLGDARLVAITGANGAGKSTLLELSIPGAMYRATPTRGSLTALATSRAARVEVQLSHAGHSYTILHLLDAVSGKSEAVVLDEDRSPLLPDSKVRSFDAWAAQNLPSADVLFASTFAPQGAAGFLGAKPGERKEILLRVLGIEHYEALAKRASERAAERLHEADKLRALRDSAASTGDVATAAQALLEAEGVANDAAKVAEAAGQALRLAQEAAASAESARRQWQEAREKRDNLAARVVALKTERAALAERVRNNEAVLADADLIADAVQRSELLREELPKLQERLQDLRGREALARQTIAALEAKEREALSREASLRAQIAQAQPLKEIASRAPELAERLSLARDAVQTCADQLEQLQGTQIAGAEVRIGAMRLALGSIVAEPEAAAHAIALDALNADQRAEVDAREHPRRLENLQRSLVDAKAELAAAEQASRRAQDAAIRLDAVDRLVSDADRAHDEAAAARGELVTARGLVPSPASMACAVEAIELVRQELAQKKPLADRADPLSRAEARLAELRPRLAEVDASLDAAVAELDALPALGVAPDVGAELKAREDAATRATEALHRAQRDAGTAEAALNAARRGDAAAARYRAEAAEAEGHGADWSRLAADLGKNGLQALEIDAAGPTLTALVNDLLHECHGPRFTIRVDTQRLSSDGRKMIEGCEVTVLDSERGREGPAETFSGGERVILSEAMSLGLSMLSCQRAGLSDVTLVRDESGAALDPANGRVWIAMLRRAVKMIGARQCLFVCHNPELVELADASINVSSSRRELAEAAQ